jgi:hypothetical protein
MALLLTNVFASECNYAVSEMVPTGFQEYVYGNLAITLPPPDVRLLQEFQLVLLGPEFIESVHADQVSIIVLYHTYVVTVSIFYVTEERILFQHLFNGIHDKYIKGP